MWPWFLFDVFVHALVRDGAYGQMPRVVRARAHERVAEWIDSLPSDRAEDRAEMLAHHLVEAVDYGRAAGLDVTTLLPKAAQAVRDAGDRAWALGTPAASLAFYERSRSLDPVAGEDPYLLLRIGRASLIVRAGGEEELDRAAAALADSDPAAAAEAEVARGEFIWQRGDRDGSFPYFERAALTVEELPPSRQKLFVISQVARFLILAGRTSEGLELIEQAIVMAQALDDDNLLVDALTTRGTARSALGDPDGIGDIEKSLALGLEINSWRAGRAYINLGSELLGFGGKVARADATYREGLRFMERLGSGLGLRWIRGNLAESTFHLGLWDEALRLADGELADPEPHYLQPQCRILRAHMRLARDDVRGALEDAELAATESRAIRDPQALIPALASRAFCVASTNDTAAAAAALAELTNALRDVGPAPGLAGTWVVDFAFALLELGREPELLDMEHELGLRTPWHDAGLAIGRGDLVPAANTLGTIGSSTLEAHVRLRAAQRLSDEGRRAEAAEQLAAALSFYRSVNAIARVREGESLRAATA